MIMLTLLECILVIWFDDQVQKDMAERLHRAISCGQRKSADKIPEVCECPEAPVSLRASW